MYVRGTWIQLVNFQSMTYLALSAPGYTLTGVLSLWKWNEVIDMSFILSRRRGREGEEEGKDTHREILLIFRVWSVGGSQSSSHCPLYSARPGQRQSSSKKEGRTEDLLTDYHWKLTLGALGRKGPS